MESWSKRALDKEILRLSLPSILANITVPLVGMVDTAVAGHLPLTGGHSTAAFIGSISVGAMMLNLIYWMAGFLRTGTGGLTAQAFGRGDMRDCGRILVRTLGLAAVIAALVLLFRQPFCRLTLAIASASSQVQELATRYFLIRIWAAPATVGLMAFRGWFVGMQDSMSSMITDLTVNVVNIASSLILSLGFGSWEGLGFDGIAFGTVAAQYCGLAYASGVALFKYGHRVFKGLVLSECFRLTELRSFMSMNADLFLRSLCFTVIYMGETIIAARFGDLYLACNAILMNLLMVFSYFTDGFAYAGEALTGRFIGERNALMLKRSVSRVMAWSIGVGLLFLGIYGFGGMPLLRLMTSDAGVVAACSRFLPWLMLMPLLGSAAFAWDGIYLGAMASEGIRDAMFAAMLSFLGIWYLGQWIIRPEGAMCLHLLMGAYFAHLLARTLVLTLRRHSSIVIS